MCVYVCVCVCVCVGGLWEPRCVRLGLGGRVTGEDQSIALTREVNVCT